eukprot:14942-Heterococcus_DN1.PRE.10
MSDTSFICAGLLMLRRSSASSDSNSMMQEDSPPSEIQGQLDGRGALSKAGSNNSSSMQVESPASEVHPQVDEGSTLSKPGSSSSSNMQVESPPDEVPAIHLQLDEIVVRRVEPVHKRDEVPAIHLQLDEIVVRRVEPVHKRAHSDLEMDTTTAPSTPDSALSSGSPAPWLSSVEDICESPSKLRRTAAAAAADASGSSSSGLARGYYSFSDSEDEKSDDSSDDSDSAAAASQQQQPAVTYTLVRKRKKFSRYMGLPAVSTEPKVPNRGKKEHVKWFTAEEDEALTAAVQELGDTDWKLIAEQVGTRDAVQYSTPPCLCSCSMHLLQQQQQCLQRWRRVLLPGLKKGLWEPEEDARLVELVSDGYNNWGEHLILSSLNSSDRRVLRDVLVSLVQRLNRYSAARVLIVYTVAQLGTCYCCNKVTCNLCKPHTSRQSYCRERWIHFLDPSIKTSPYTQEEDDKLWQLQKKLGNKWSQIAAQLPGRTELSVKVRWRGVDRFRRTGVPIKRRPRRAPTRKDSTTAAATIDTAAAAGADTAAAAGADTAATAGAAAAATGATAAPAGTAAAADQPAVRKAPAAPAAPVLALRESPTERFVSLQLALQRSEGFIRASAAAAEREKVRRRAAAAAKKDAARRALQAQKPPQVVVLQTVPPER